jgi:hypothetical protein
MSDTESDSETDSERADLEAGLGKTASIIEKSLSEVNTLICGLQRLHSQLSVMENLGAPIQKDMFIGKYEIRKDIQEISLVKGQVVTYKELVGKIIAWIDEEEMETGGVIKPTAAFSAVFGLKKTGVTFPEVLGRLKKIIH